MSLGPRTVHWHLRIISDELVLGTNSAAFRVPGDYSPFQCKAFTGLFSGKELKDVNTVLCGLRDPLFYGVFYKSRGFFLVSLRFFFETPDWGSPGSGGCRPWCYLSHGEAGGAGQRWSPDIRVPGTRRWCSVWKGLHPWCHAAVRYRSTSPKFVTPPK